VETGQARPTDAAYVVFQELSKELEGHLAKLNQLISSDLKNLNTQLPSQIVLK
jgi:hypothetical protein